MPKILDLIIILCIATIVGSCVYHLTGSIWADFIAAAVVGCACILLFRK